MRLSEHFTLDELLASQTATRHGIDMTPDDEVLENLSVLVVDFLEPLRVEVDSPMIITSGFRPPELNTRIGGSPTSAHRFGRAADFHVVGMTPFAVAESAFAIGLKYDQLILEFFKWVHLGTAVDPREQELTATHVDGKVHYEPGLWKE